MKTQKYKNKYKRMHIIITLTEVYAEDELQKAPPNTNTPCRMLEAKPRPEVFIYTWGIVSWEISGMSYLFIGALFYLLAG